MSMHRKGGSLLVPSRRFMILHPYPEFTPGSDTFDACMTNIAATMLPWYAIRVRSNYEQAVSVALHGKGYEQYLPTYQKRSARIRNLQLPLFPGYVFCRFNINQRLPLVTTPGVVNIVSFGSEFIPVPESDIEAVQAIVRSGLPCLPWPYLQEGDRVRIENGSLAGVEGVLVCLKNEFRIVISVPMLNRAVAVEVDRDWIQPITRAAR